MGFRVFLAILSPIMENHIEIKMENEMDTGGIYGLKELFERNRKSSALAEGFRFKLEVLAAKPDSF